MKTKPKILDIVVNMGFCVGCGICVSLCPKDAIEMKWNAMGFLEPVQTGICDVSGICLDVCPFNPEPKSEVRDENRLAKLFLDECTKFHPKIGHYIGVYAGYSKKFRMTSSAGGLATYVLAELLNQKDVDFVIAIRESEKSAEYYEYSICQNTYDLVEASKTKYFPVTMAGLMSMISRKKGNFAIVGVPCFIKALRLAQYTNRILRKRIIFMVGIICGGMKSKFFTEYLASKAGVIPENCSKPQFRIKNINSDANDYAFGCLDLKSLTTKTIRMRMVGDMWGSGMFKAKACDYCDDVVAELADISLGDAWLEPYIRDGKGTNLVITRSLMAHRIIQEGVRKGEIYVEPISLDRLIMSQRGNFNHRHRGLPFRIRQERRKGVAINQKRFSNCKASFDFRMVQRLRMRIRYRSLIAWKNSRNAQEFEKTMENDLRKLRLATRIYHHKNRLAKELKRIFSR